MYQACIDSPFGQLLLCADHQGLTGLYFTDQKDCPPMTGKPAARPDSLHPSSGIAQGRALSTLRVSAAHAQADKHAAAYMRQAELSTDLAVQLSPLLEAKTTSLHFLQNDTPADVVQLLSHVQAWLDNYFAGEQDPFGYRLALSGTPFQLQVWQALRSIPYGELVSYAELAAQAGLTQQHSRAVGGAVGRNPVSIIVPCHRIVGANHTLTGYAGGLSRKVALLKLEGIQFDQ